jgi:hypothetical protein
MSLGSEKYIDNIYHLLDGFVVYILQNMILETCKDEYIYYVYQYNNKMNRNLYIEY